MGSVLMEYFLTCILLLLAVAIIYLFKKVRNIENRITSMRADVQEIVSLLQEMDEEDEEDEADEAHINATIHENTPVTGNTQHMMDADVLLMNTNAENRVEPNLARNNDTDADSDDEDVDIGVDCDEDDAVGGGIHLKSRDDETDDDSDIDVEVPIHPYNIVCDGLKCVKRVPVSDNDDEGETDDETDHDETEEAAPKMTNTDSIATIGVLYLGGSPTEATDVELAVDPIEEATEVPDVEMAVDPIEEADDVIDVNAQFLPQTETSTSSISHLNEIKRMSANELKAYAVNVLHKPLSEVSRLKKRELFDYVVSNM